MSFYKKFKKKNFESLNFKLCNRVSKIQIVSRGWVGHSSLCVVKRSFC